MTQSLIQDKLIIQYQHGFTREDPVSDKSTNGFKDWTSGLDNGIGPDIIFLDL